MDQPNPRRRPGAASEPRPGEIAHAEGHTLNSCRLGALPIIERLLKRHALEEFLRAYLPRADRRCRIDPTIGITLLLKNVLLAREPLYGVGEWAACSSPKHWAWPTANSPHSTTTAPAVVSIACSNATSPRWS